MEDIKSNYKIKTRTLISSEYNEFLYQLYLPLIGYKSVFLYEYFTNELKFGKNKMKLEEILNRSSMNLQDFLFERKMLESIGLISTFKKDNDYIIIINPILSPKNFFNDDVLKGLLIQKIGKTKALEIMKRYEIDEDSEGFREITSSITDNFVFDFEFDDLKLGKELKLTGTNKINRNEDFDDVFFMKQLLKISNICAEAITNKELKKIHNTGVIYNLNEKIMSEIVRDCFDPTRSIGSKIDLELLNTRAIGEVIAAKSYNKRKGAQKVKLTSDSDIAKKLEYYQSLSPREFLKETQNGVEPITSDLYIVEYLSTNMEFDYSIINVILAYCLENCNNQLNRKYIEKIAATLKRSKCITCLDALNLLYGKKSNKMEEKEEKNNKKQTISLDLDDTDIEDLI